MDAPLREYPLDATYARAYAESLAPTEKADTFALGRYEEGRRWRGVLEQLGAPHGPILDIASGSGGIALAVTAAGRAIVSIDSIWGETARHAHRRAGVSYMHAAGDAERLPVRNETFAAVFCMDAIEHFAAPGRAAEEIARALKPGGCIILTTPPRLAYMFRRDPHFNIPLLLMLPPRLQRWMAARRGFTDPHHYVGRIFVSAGAIARLFPRCRVERILNRSRFPDALFWDAIVLRKEP